MIIKITKRPSEGMTLDLMTPEQKISLIKFRLALLILILKKL
jgi:hypothetical protein